MPTILVADDNSNIQKMVSLVFKEKGIRVVAVGNGEAACRKVPEVQPDVVLADVFMPVRNGYEVCEFVKQDPQFAETPVILLVGAFDPLDEKEAQRVGANGVLKKPFVPPEPLVAMVSSLLKLDPPAEEPQPAPAPEDSLTPQAPPEESGPSARQLAIAAAQAQYAEADTDETVTTFSAPVAIPSNQAQEIEPEADSEPGTEWARRRAAVDYEIDSADSANMVEKLAAENTVEEPEILASNKHLPFGGANVPVSLPETAAEPAPAKWSDSVPEAAERAVKAPAPEITAPEISVPVETTSPAVGPEDSAHHDLGFGSAAPHLMPADEIAVQASQAESEPEAASTVAPWAVSPVPSEPAAQARDAAAGEAANSWSAPQTDPEPAMPEPPLALPETVSYATPVHTGAAADVIAPVTDVDAGKPAPKAMIDQATVDEVVAKVISKLEPQLHQALANGVLRPLVEELLNQQRDKK